MNWRSTACSIRPSPGPVLYPATLGAPRPAVRIPPLAGQPPNPRGGEGEDRALPALSHPFVERLVGTMRRELLDQILFWSARDLERQLPDSNHYDRERSHAASGGVTPNSKAGDVDRRIVSLGAYRWQSHCRGLYWLPVAVLKSNSPQTSQTWRLEL